jgi:hypothetical protein
MGMELLINSSNRKIFMAFFLKFPWQSLLSSGDGVVVGILVGSLAYSEIIELSHDK